MNKRGLFAKTALGDFHCSREESVSGTSSPKIDFHGVRRRYLTTGETENIPDMLNCSWDHCRERSFDPRGYINPLNLGQISLQKRVEEKKTCKLSTYGLTEKERSDANVQCKQEYSDASRIPDQKRPRLSPQDSSCLWRKTV